jgi:hypothetical protein
MRELRTTFSKYLVCAVAVGMASGLGWSDRALAQADLNIQSRLQTYAFPLVPTLSDILRPTDNQGACLADAAFIVMLKQNGLLKLKESLAALDNGLSGIFLKQNPLYGYLKENAHKQEAANILADFFKDPANVRELKKKVPGYFFSLSGLDTIKLPNNSVSKRTNKFTTFIGFPISFCIDPTATQTQSTTKISLPITPTAESNVLKSNLNNSHGESFGFGGAVQIVTPMLKSFDLIAVTAASQSVRYDPFSSKSFDSLTAQAAYQFFLGASGYDSNGNLVGRITPKTDPSAIPPVNMITVQSVALGFQNQTVFVPTFHSESVNLFTPQVSYNAQNIPFAGPGACQAAIPDPRREGFCYAADFSLTVGQTFADVTTQQNANVAVALTPGVRIDHSDWKVTLPITATGRAYEDVPVRRDDVLLQVGPAFAYSPPSLYTTPGGDTIAAQFTFSATYNRNYSTLATAAWHGYVALANLTFAFVPASPPKPQ